MVRPHAKRPFCPDPSVTLQVLRLRRTRFEDEVGMAIECRLIEPQLAHRPDGISTGKRPSQPGCRTKRPSHFRDIKVDRFRIADYPGVGPSMTTSAFVGINPQLTLTSEME